MQINLVNAKMNGLTVPSPWFTIEQNESSMLGCIETILIACSQPGQYGVALEQINAMDRING